jgi:hypothetical protein
MVCGSMVESIAGGNVNLKTGSLDVSGHLEDGVRGLGVPVYVDAASLCVCPSNLVSNQIQLCLYGGCAIYRCGGSGEGISTIGWITCRVSLVSTR